MDKYTELISSQHRQQPKFTATVETLTEAVAHIKTVVQKIPYAFDLDEAVGAQLDIVGLWVGQSRYIKDTIPAEFFGFFDTPAALGFGEEGMLWIGGRWYEEGESTLETSKLNDHFYRMLIRAKIVKNHYRGGFAGIIAGAKQIFGDVHVTVQDKGHMAMRVNIGRTLSRLEQAIVKKLDIIPRPAGVLIEGYGYFPPNWLGFEDQVEFGAVTFAEEGYIGPNAHFMEEF